MTLSSEFYRRYCERALLHKSRFVVARSAFCDEAIQFFMHFSETGLLRPEKRPRNDDFFCASFDLRNNARLQI